MGLVASTLVLRAVLFLTEGSAANLREWRDEVTCRNPVVRFVAERESPEAQAAARAGDVRLRRETPLWLAEIRRLDSLGTAGRCAVRVALHSLTVRYDGDARTNRAIIRLRRYLDKANLDKANIDKADINRADIVTQTTQIESGNLL